MTGPASQARRAAIEGLRSEIARKFPDATRPADRVRGPAIASGWEAVDRGMPGGGLGPGETAVLEGEPGSGALALAASWARAAARAGEPVAVLDPEGTAAPHAWVEAPDARAPIWVIRPPGLPEIWPAADITLRSGAFGLVVLLEPGTAPPGVGPRLIRLARDRGARLVVTGRAPFAPTARVHLRACAIDWDEGPTGAAPAARALETRTGPGVGAVGTTTGEVRREDVVTDRLRAIAPAADRRPPSGRGGAAAREAGRSGRGPRR